jgi:hypothetical protein
LTWLDNIPDKRQLGKTACSRMAQISDAGDTFVFVVT